MGEELIGYIQVVYFCDNSILCQRLHLLWYPIDIPTRSKSVTEYSLTTSRLKTTALAILLIPLDHAPVKDIR